MSYKDFVKNGNINKLIALLNDKEALRNNNELFSYTTAIVHGSDKPRIIIGLATCGISAGGNKVELAVKEELRKRNIEADIKPVGCIGMCAKEVLLDIALPNSSRICYGNVLPEDVPDIIEQTLVNGKVFEDRALWKIAPPDVVPLPGEYRPIEGESSLTEFYELPIMKKQERIVLKRSGIINPESIDEYLAYGGYRALKRCIEEYSPEEVIDIVLKSGLRGRGGGGFPTGRKWKFTREANGDVRYIICNADEGDPGAFMDRAVLEGDPHNLLEGMIIAGYAIGAKEGYIYVRAEYPLAVRRLEIAIKDCYEYGLLGSNIMGSDFSFDIYIVQGAGAFVCGEETALISSIEGKRGMPSVKPPFPATKGLYGKPTNVNNVETYANISAIINNGWQWFANIGTEKSKGTKVFALAGKITNTGLVEVPMGITLKEIIYDIGGGIPDGKKFKAAQTGGPSGGCIPAQYLDLPIDYDSLKEVGAIMGSGGLIIMDENTCMVDLAKFFLNFTQAESCGKCVPCREGTKRMLEMLERITEGKAEDDVIEKLVRLGTVIKQTSACGLGQTAPNPVLSTIRYFEDEYKAHIEDKRCPAGVCKSFITYEILSTCRGCTLCAKVCPVDAISGAPKQLHVIDQDKCIKCGECMAKCPFGAIIRS